MGDIVFKIKYSSKWNSDRQIVSWLSKTNRKIAVIIIRAPNSNKKIIKKSKKNFICSHSNYISALWLSSIYEKKNAKA